MKKPRNARVKECCNADGAFATELLTFVVAGALLGSGSLFEASGCTTDYIGDYWGCLRSFDMCRLKLR